ncbi:MAG: hypothetical protein Q8P72_07165 [Candidatus Roizmanbacteria bacterium]|nr:hypothetical protein [Candidatus Roizmanbacteria bacterium]
MSKEIDPLDLYKRYKESDYGAQLFQQPRFGIDTIKPKGISTDDWTLLLGPDVNNLWHLPHSVNVATMYEILDDPRHARIPQDYPILAGFFSDKYQVLQVAAVVHDIQEVLIGDINIHDKTMESQQREEEVFHTMMRSLYGDYFRDGAIQEIAQIVFHQSNPLGYQFQIIEEMGYVMTALQADHITNGSPHLQNVLSGRHEGRDEGLLPESRGKLSHLVYDVIHTTLPRLISKSSTNVASCAFLTNSAPDIDAALMRQNCAPDLIKQWSGFMGRDTINLSES